MGLNAREIQLRLLRVLQVSFEISYTYMQRHPLISGALLVLFILYIFLSYIYNLLVFLSPFLVCTAIFVRIFWSSEQTQLRCVEKKREKEKVESKTLSKIAKCDRRAMLYKYPSQNATSRRRNFTGKKLDVYGGLEEKAKDLSSVFRNEFTKKNREFSGIKHFDKEMDPWDYKFPTKKLEVPTKQTLFSEPSMVTSGAICGDQENKEDEKKAQEDSNKAVEFSEDDQKNKMDLGICEMERNKRLESLIARRRARKQLRLQIENGLVDMKSVIPSQIAPLFVSRVNPFDSPRDFEGIEMPGSAPALRSPFDLPYDPLEEKPNLTGDNFGQEFTSHQKDMLLEPRQDNEARGHRPAYPRARTLPGKINYDRPELLISIEGSESEQAPNPQSEGEETTHEEDEKCKFDMASMKGEEVENSDATKSMSDHTSEPNLTNVKRVRVSEKLGPSSPKPQERVLDSPISSPSPHDINDSLYESLSTPVYENKEDMFSTGGNICHAPTGSLASDLQVEVSDVGSPTLTVDESHETITTTDGDSIVYDGDVDKDVTSGSEDMWGASLHSREVRGISEQDISEVNNWRDIASPLARQNIIDEENAADVSSMSSRSDLPDDTPTYAMSNDHNIFGGNMRETGASQPSHSPDVLARWKRLMRLMDTRMNHLPHGMHSEKSEARVNQAENLLNKAQVINDVNNSAATEQDNTQDSRYNEDPGASVIQQEAADEVSINSSSSSSSPRSVLSIPQKTIADHVSSSAYNQETHLGVQQSNKEEVAQETLNVEGPLDSMPQIIQPSMGYPNVESHNGDTSHSQEQTYPRENSIQESNMSGKMNGAEVINKEEEKNDENSEDKLTPLITQEASAEPPKLAEIMTSDDMTGKLKELIDGKVPLISLILESSREIHTGNEDKSHASVRQEATMQPFINAEATNTSSAKYFEGKHNDFNENEARLSSYISAEESGKLSEKNKASHSSEEVNYLQSESKHMEKENLDKGDISKDPLLPMVTEVTNAEDTSGESDKMNKNEATDQELNKTNETIVLSKPAGENDQVNNISHMNNDHEDSTSA